MSSVSTKVEYEVVREDALGPIVDELVAVFNATRSRAADRERFDWLYLQNPDGNAVIWSLRKSDTGEMVGFTACLPRRMIVNGREQLAWIGSDFSILPKFRTLGLAVKLRRAAKSAIDDGEVDLLYAHPNDRMAVIHQRVGHRPVGFMQRYAKLLRTAPLISDRFNSRLLTGMGRSLIDPALTLTDSLIHRRREYSIQSESLSSLDGRFSDLFDKHRPDSGIVGVRDQAYLQWRYADNPLGTYQLLTARNEQQQFCGYLVYTVLDGTIVIKDLFPGSKILVRDLLAEVSTIGRDQGLQSATFTLLEATPLQRIVTECGFRPRAERSEMFSYSAPSAGSGGSPVGPDSWHITVGDRDV